MRAVVLLFLAGLGGVASAQTRIVPPRSPVVTPWITTQCWVEHRWFETLRSGPVDYCKRSLRFRPGKIDCLGFTDEVCWAVNQQTGEGQQLRTEGIQNLIVCPEGPEPPTCPRLR
jgi:hypothetical protein